MQKMNHFGGKKKSRENEACGKKKINESYGERILKEKKNYVRK